MTAGPGFPAQSSSPPTSGSYTWLPMDFLRAKVKVKIPRSCPSASKSEFRALVV